MSRTAKSRTCMHIGLGVILSLSVVRTYSAIRIRVKEYSNIHTVYAYIYYIYVWTINKKAFVNSQTSEMLIERLLQKKRYSLIKLLSLKTICFCACSTMRSIHSYNFIVFFYCDEFYLAVHESDDPISPHTYS